MFHPVWGFVKICLGTKVSAMYQIISIILFSLKLKGHFSHLDKILPPNYGTPQNRKKLFPPIRYWQKVHSFALPFLKPHTYPQGRPCVTKSRPILAVQTSKPTGAAGSHWSNGTKNSSRIFFSSKLFISPFSSPGELVSISCHSRARVFFFTSHFLCVPASASKVRIHCSFFEFLEFDSFCFCFDLCFKSWLQMLISFFDICICMRACVCVCVLITAVRISLDGWDAAGDVIRTVCVYILLELISWFEIWLPCAESGRERRHGEVLPDCEWGIQEGRWQVQEEAQRPYRREELCSSDAPYRVCSLSLSKQINAIDF